MKEVYEGIVSFLKNYQERTHVKGYVLDISGGKEYGRLFRDKEKD